jgi:hypothetical protein
VELDQELRRIAEAAARHCGENEELAGIIPAEPGSGFRVYVCAYRDGDETSWLVLDADGAPVEDRSLVRDAVSVSALQELAEEAAGEDGNGEPRIASPAELDRLAATADDRAAFVDAMKQATETVDELVRDVERGYKTTLRP